MPSDTPHAAAPASLRPPTPTPAAPYRDCRPAHPHPVAAGAGSNPPADRARFCSYVAPVARNGRARPVTHPCRKDTAHRTRACRHQHGARRPPPTRGYPSLRPRLSMYQFRLRQTVSGDGRDSFCRLGGRRVRSCHGRERPCFSGVRTVGSAVFPHAGGGDAGCLRMHRRLVQPPKAALVAGLPVARTSQMRTACRTHQSSEASAAKRDRSHSCQIRYNHEGGDAHERYTTSLRALLPVH